MRFTDMTFFDFTEKLASADPVPGGGGAAAFTAALAASLGSMVCNLTVGKEKYAVFEKKASELLASFEEKRRELLSLADEDAAAYMPLSKAYKLPKDDDSRDYLIEEALSPAAGVPLSVMRLCGELIELFAALYGNSTPYAVSDVAVGASLAVAAMESASVNVYVNTQAMKRDFYASLMEREADELCAVYKPMAAKLFSDIENGMRIRKYETEE